MADTAKQVRRKAPARNNGGRSGSAAPTPDIGDEFQRLVSALADRVLSTANDRVGGLTDKLTGVAQASDSPIAKAATKAGDKVAEGKSPLRAGLAAGVEGIKSTVSKAMSSGGKGGGKGTKVVNIIEQIDIGAPINLVYDQWTQFQDFSNFMKKVEGVDQKDDQKLAFKAQVLWSHRTWEATIVEQVPDSRIIWRSSGEKGHVDGAVTFHELAPDLTRVLVVLEYHPQGLFERTGNLWRAQGRRVRLELKNFRRHVMAHTLLHPDDVDGWRGEIHDSKVTKSAEQGRAETGRQAAESDEEDEYDEGEADDEDAESDEYESEDEAEEEEEPDEESEDEESDEDELSDEYEEESEEDEDEDEDEDELEDEDESDEDLSDEYEEESDEESEDDEYEDESDEQAEGGEDEIDEDRRPPRRARPRKPARAGRR